MDKLDAKPNIERLRKAMDALSNGKAPGIPRPAPQRAALSLLEGTVPQDMRDATIITPDKNQGDRSEYNNYRLSLS